MRILFAAAVTLACITAVQAQSNLIASDFVAGVLRVPATTVKIEGTTDMPDVFYEISTCRLGARAARRQYLEDLVTLLPAILSKYPEADKIKISGGCEYVDQYGRSHFDDGAISAMWERKDLKPVVWENVDREFLFNKLSYGHWANPDLR